MHTTLRPIPWPPGQDARNCAMSTASTPDCRAVPRPGAVARLIGSGARSGCRRRGDGCGRGCAPVGPSSLVLPSRSCRPRRARTRSPRWWHRIRGVSGCGRGVESGRHTTGCGTSDPAGRSAFAGFSEMFGIGIPARSTPPTVGMRRCTATTSRHLHRWRRRPVAARSQPAPARNPAAAPPRARRSATFRRRARGSPSPEYPTSLRLRCPGRTTSPPSADCGCDHRRSRWRSDCPHPTPGSPAGRPPAQLASAHSDTPSNPARGVL